MAEPDRAVFAFDGGDEFTALFLQFGTGFLVDRDLALGLEIGKQQLLAYRQGRVRLFAGRGHGKGLLGIVYFDQSLDAKIEDRGGQRGPAGFFKAPFVDIMGQRRGKILGRVEQGDNRALGRIAADPVPGDQIIGQHQYDAQDGQDDFAQIGEPDQQGIESRRQRQYALLEFDGKAHTLACAKRAIGAERGRRIRIAGDGHCLFGRANGAGIADQISDHGARRQGYMRDRIDDGENPVIAGGVPIELVMIGKAARHAGHGIGDDIAVLAASDEAVAVADPDTEEIAHALGAEGLELTVTRNGQHI
ncbi:hypothetical protein FF80_02281 [Devosia sp. LC5]|nr:hypothetical protein FF80_02281 [Devosia sp. LC5]